MAPSPDIPGHQDIGTKTRLSAKQTRLIHVAPSYQGIDCPILSYPGIDSHLGSRLAISPERRTAAC